MATAVTPTAPVQAPQPLHADQWLAQQANAPPPQSPSGPMHAEDWLAQQAAPGLGETVLDQASRGLSFGFAPQLMGAIKGAEAGGKYALADMHGEGPPATATGLGNAISSGYTSGRDALRTQYDQEAAAHPVISRVADIGGSLGGALLSGGTNLLGSAAERLAPNIAGNMLGRVVTRGTLPAIEAGAARAVGETRDNNYAGNIAQSIPASAILGSLFGAAGQVGGRLAEARAGAAAKGAQYAASDAAEIDNPQLLDKFRDYITRPGFARAYQKAVDDAADEGKPLPSLPPIESPAPLGRLPNSVEGTHPGPFSEGLPVRVVDAMKRAVDDLHDLPKGAAGKLTTAARDQFYQDIVGPATEAVPVFGAARASAEKVIQARKLAEMLTTAGKSPVSTVLGGAAGLALGHNPLATGLGALGGRVVRGMAGQPAAAGVVPDATAVIARALASAAAQRDAQP